MEIPYVDLRLHTLQSIPTSPTSTATLSQWNEHLLRACGVPGAMLSSLHEEDTFIARKEISIYYEATSIKGFSDLPEIMYQLMESFG